MDYTILAMETIKRRMEEYEKYTKWKSKKEIENSTLILAEQIKIIREISLINMATVNHYLSELKNLYQKKIYAVRHLEEREQLINLNDDFFTNIERLFIDRKIENNYLKKENMSLAEWKEVIKEEKKYDTSSGTGNNEREELILVRSEDKVEYK